MEMGVRTVEDRAGGRDVAKRGLDRGARDDMEEVEEPPTTSGLTP
jgi:hypothetical protein